MVDAHKLAWAEHLRDCGHTIAKIVEMTGIARSSLYRHLPPRPPEAVTAAGPVSQDRDGLPSADGEDAGPVPGAQR
jgi:hypothetical protein